MTYLFKKIAIIFCISINVYSSQINIYFYEAFSKESIIIKEIFMTKYNIPSYLIKRIETSKCESIDKRFLEICINKKGELTQLSNMKTKKIVTSLLAFKRRN